MSGVRTKEREESEHSLKPVVQGLERHTGFQPLTTLRLSGFYGVQFSLFIESLLRTTKPF